MRRGALVVALVWSAAAQAEIAPECEGLPKPARKVLRRLHHRLRSRGVETPAAPPEPTVGRLPGIDDSLSGASVPDERPREADPGQGVRALQGALVPGGDA